MAIRVSKIASMADDETPELRVQPTEMNPFTLPVTPLESDIWFDTQGNLGQTGSSFAFKIYRNGAWVTVYAISF